MLKHRNLEASRIRTLVQEYDATTRINDVAGEAIVRIAEKLVPAVKKGRRLTGSELLTIMDELDTDIRSGVVTILSRSETIKATRARPKGEAYERCYVFVHALNKESVQLVSIRVFGTRKSIKIESQMLPVGFTYHAAERILERTRNVDLAFKELGAALLDMLAFYKLTESFSLEKLKGDLLLPDRSGNGIALGSIHAMDWKVIGAEFGAYGMKRYQPIHVWPPGTKFVAHTFVNTAQLGEDQVRLAEAIRDWRETRRPAYDSLLRHSCWGEHITNIELQAGLGLEMMQTMRAEAIAILDDPASIATVTRRHQIKRGPPQTRAGSEVL